MDLEIFKHELEEKSQELEAKVRMFDKRVTYFEQQKSSVEHKVICTNEINEINDLIGMNNPDGFIECVHLEFMTLMHRWQVLLVLLIIVFLIKYYVTGVSGLITLIS